jgi:hypothetical protein
VCPVFHLGFEDFKVKELLCIYLRYSKIEGGGGGWLVHCYSGCKH